MKKHALWVVAAILVAAVLVAVPLSRFVFADPPKGDGDKVLICQVSGNDGTGKVISVDENAIPAHVEHGDCRAPKGAEKGDDCKCAKKE
jgi:hypothetical protein